MNQDVLLKNNNSGRCIREEENREKYMLSAEGFFSVFNMTQFTSDAAGQFDSQKRQFVNMF